MALFGLLLGILLLAIRLVSVQRMVFTHSVQPSMLLFLGRCTMLSAGKDSDSNDNVPHTLRFPSPLLQHHQSSTLNVHTRITCIPDVLHGLFRLSIDSPLVSLLVPHGHDHLHDGVMEATRDDTDPLDCMVVNTCCHGEHMFRVLMLFTSSNL